MDKCTREVRKKYWKNIITQCLQRPKDMTAKQWLSENGICEQSYYHWLKRIRQETYELATNSLGEKDRRIYFETVLLHHLCWHPF